MADRDLVVQEDFNTFGLGHPDFQKYSRLPQTEGYSSIDKEDR